MARALENVKAFIRTDKDGAPGGTVLWSYEVVDGGARKRGDYADEAPTFTKTLHNAGSVGEFWRDGIDAIKTAEGIS